MRLRCDAGYFKTRVGAAIEPGCFKISYVRTRVAPGIHWACNSGHVFGNTKEALEG